MPALPTSDSCRNPVWSSLSAADTVVLEALGHAWEKLSSASDRLRELNYHGYAELLEQHAEEIRETYEHAAGEIFSSGDESDKEQGSLEEELACIFADWLEYLEAGNSSRFYPPDDQKAFVAVLRSAAQNHNVFPIDQIDQVTDDMLIGAAQDAWAYRNSLYQHLGYGCQP